MDSLIDRATVYQGETLLLRWGESPKGRSVTFQLDPMVGSEHPFKGLKCGESGQRLMLVAVLIGDNEEPQPHAVEAPRQVPTPDVIPIKKALTRSQQAALRLQDQDFLDWMYQTFPTETEYGNPDHGLKTILGITSKKELDTDPFKAAEWDKLKTSFELRGYAR